MKTSLHPRLAATSVAAAPGDVDATFNPEADHEMYAVAVQADGKVIFFGRFTNFGGEVCNFPSTRIEGSETVYRDIEAALEAAPDGSTLFLDGVFVCRTVHFGPVGRRLSLRPAPAFHFANDASPEGAGAAPIRWEGRGNRHASPLFRLSWTVPGDGGSSLQTKEIDLGETLVPPLLGSEENLVIAPLRPPEGTSPTIEHLEAAVGDDPDFSPIRAKEEG